MTTSADLGQSDDSMIAYWRERAEQAEAELRDVKLRLEVAMDRANKHANGLLREAYGRATNDE